MRFTASEAGSARRAALHSPEASDISAEPKFDRLVAHAARIFYLPTALISLADGDRLWFKAYPGLDLRLLAHLSAFHAQVIYGDEVIVVPDARLDPRFADNPLVTRKPGFRFYAGAPLIAPDGHRLGTFCLLDRKPRKMTPAKRESLRDLAAIAVDELRLHQEISARTRAGEATPAPAIQNTDESAERYIAAPTLELPHRTKTLEEELRRREIAANERRQSVRRLRQLFNQASDAAFVHDEDGRLLDVNTTACRTLGYSREELLELRVADLETAPIPNGGRRFWKELSAGDTKCLEGCHRRKDGSTFPTEIHVSVLETSEGRHLLALVRDISERKRSEELLRTRARQQDAVARLGSRALSGGPIDELLQEAIVTVCDTLEVEICRIHEHVPAKGEFILCAGVGLPTNIVGTVTARDQVRSVVGQILREAEPVILEDIAAETRFDIGPDLLAAGVQSCCGVLIGGRNATDLHFGVLGASSLQKRVFTEDDIAFVQSVANVLAAAIARQRTEDALRVVEARYQRIAHNTPGMVYQHLTQPDGRIVLLFVSEGSRQIYGLEPRQLYENPQRMIDCVHPEDRHDLVRRVEFTNTSLIPLHWEGRHLLPGGEVRWMRVDSRPERLPDGGVICDGIIIDITAQKKTEEALRRSEERFRSAILHSPFPLMLHASDGEVLQINDAWTEQTGYLPEELATIEDWFQRAYAAEEARQEARRLLSVLRDRTTPIRNVSQRVMCADGQERIWDVSAAGLGRLPDGRWLYISTAIDVTERHRGEVALRQAKEEAERANAAKSGFLSRMSHELRTPLNAILGFGQVLELREFGEQDGQCVRFILKAGRHLLSLVDEILDLARVDAGELFLVPAALSFDSLAQECLGFVARLAQARQITCQAEVPASGPVLVWADEQRLRQVLLNLLANAIKYNREEGSVVLGCEHLAGSGWVRLKVTDSGPGISPEDLSRLFVPFERLGQESGEIEGTGLGLVVSKHLVEAMGGRMGVESAVGRGSTFWIELPAAKLVGPERTAKSAPAAPLGRVSVEDSPVKLLYIEDNVSNLQVMKTIIDRLRPDWQFLSAHDGPTGLRLAREHLPDLVLLDLQLPGMKGDAVLSQLRADVNTAHLPVVLLSADATAHSRDRLLALGADDYVSKPFNIAGLLEKLDRTLLGARGIPARAKEIRGVPRL